MNPACPFCQRPGLPCTGADKAECRERERGTCGCRAAIRGGTVGVVTPFGPGTVAGDCGRFLLDGQPVMQVEVPRVVLDGPPAGPAPFQVSIHPADSWLAAHPGPQRAYAWYPLPRVHLPACWKVRDGTAW
jgi:hypothetical protein